MNQALRLSAALPYVNLEICLVGFSNRISILHKMRLCRLLRAALCSEHPRPLCQAAPQKPGGQSSNLFSLMTPGAWVAVSGLMAHLWAAPA